MAKRFIDTALNKEPWFRKLKPRLKCAVRFLFDECDVAGVWIIDMETMAYFVGESVTVEELFLGMNSDKSNRIEKFKDDKIFIPGFTNFQYGHLTESCKPHRPIIEKLKKYGLYERVLKGYQNPPETLEEKEKDKEEEKEKEKEGGTGGKFLIPRMSGIHKSNNQNYMPDKERDYKPLYSIATFLCRQANVNGPPEHHVEKVCEAWESISKYIQGDKFYSQKTLSTISNHIQEITQKAVHGDKSGQVSGKRSAVSDEVLKRKLAERYGDG